MKRPLSRRQRGFAFTLIELLVVMGIIAILASVIVANVGSVLRFAKRTKANANAVQIQTAVMSYYQEYGIYPTADAPSPTPQDDFYTGQTSGMAAWQNMMIALCGNVNPYSGLSGGATPAIPNTRSIVYLQPTRSDLDANGVLTNPFGSSGTSTYFYMAVDTDYSGVVGDSGAQKGAAASAGGMPDFTHYPTNYVAAGGTLPNGIPGGIAVWCPCDQPLAGGTTSKPSPASFWAHTY